MILTHMVQFGLFGGASSKIVNLVDNIVTESLDNIVTENGEMLLLGSVPGSMQQPGLWWLAIHFMR